jgi:hypothetical protein
MCLAMNPDKLAPGERCASTFNRNFEGRQGYKGRTHLVSPAMAAAAAIAGHFVNVRGGSNTTGNDDSPVMAGACPARGPKRSFDAPSPTTLRWAKARASRLESGRKSGESVQSVTRGLPRPSWPGLSRPSTSYLLKCRQVRGCPAQVYSRAGRRSDPVGRA